MYVYILVYFFTVKIKSSVLFCSGRGHGREPRYVRLQSALPGGRVHTYDRRDGHARVERARPRPGVPLSAVTRRASNGRRPGGSVTRCVCCSSILG